MNLSGDKDERTFYLDSGLVEFGDSGQFFSAINIGIMTFGKSRLQLLQLLLREGRPVSTTSWSRTSTTANCFVKEVDAEVKKQESVILNISVALSPFELTTE